MVEKKRSLSNIPEKFLDSDGDGIGDIAGITMKLDYLINLGIDVIWLCPIYDSPNDDNGYDIRGYYKIMAEFGSIADFENLLKEAHKRNLKIIMDLVVNHTSDEHEWFVQSKMAHENPYRDFYIWRDGKEGKEPNNWGSIFSGPAWEYDEKTRQFYLHIFSRKQPDLNWDNPDLRKEIYRMMKYWLDKGIDGFRMDVINFISKAPDLTDGEKEGRIYGDGSPFFINGPRVHEYLKEMHTEVLSQYDILTVGETPGASPEDAMLYTNPVHKELNMIFTFEHMDLDSGPTEKWDVRPLSLLSLKEHFEKWQTKLYGNGWNSLYWNNHDQPRIVSRFGDDQKYRIESAKMLATCLHLLQGTPYIYQGEEIGMTNVQFQSIEDYKDIETLNMYNEKQAMGIPADEIMKAIYAKGRDNARTPMQWSNQLNAGFSSGVSWIGPNPRYREINVEQAVADQQSIYYHYQHLISLRKKLDIITTGDFNLLLREDPSIFAYERRNLGEKLIVLCNFSNKDKAIEDKELIREVEDAQLIIQNYQDIEKMDMLRPFETRVFYKI